MGNFQTDDRKLQAAAESLRAELDSCGDQGGQKLLVCPEMDGTEQPPARAATILPLQRHEANDWNVDVCGADCLPPADRRVVDFRSVCDSLGSREDALDLQHGDLVDQLAELDDAFFDAIAGRAAGSAAFCRMWPRAKRSLPARVIDESREQYMRFIMNDWSEMPSLPPAGRADADGPALQVLQLLLADEISLG